MRGRRVQIPAFMDAWWRGDRYGVIVSESLHTYRVKMDKSGRTYRIDIAQMDNYGEYL